MKLFERVANGKGFRLGNTGKYAGLAGITSGKREVKIRPVASTTDPRLSEHQAYAYAVTSAATSLGLDVKKALMLDFSTPEQYGLGDAYDLALSEYYNKTLSYACRKVKL